jgi:hypothetical protein
MALQSFEDFCTSLCAVLGVDAPPLDPDMYGDVGFTVTYRGAHIGFTQSGHGEARAALMSVTFGLPPPDKEAEILRALMEANYLMARFGAPAFMRNPVTGEISLHYCMQLSQVDIPTVYSSIAHAAEAVAEWNKGHFLERRPSLGSMGETRATISDLA